jgi:hypothetical protein
MRKAWSKTLSKKLRGDRPPVDWVSIEHYKCNHDFLDALEEESPGVIWALGVWPDVDVARMHGLAIHDLVSARRIMGVPAMTRKRFDECERRIGPLCDLLLLKGKDVEAFRLRRWMAGLYKVSLDRTRGKRQPGEMWWTANACRPKVIEEPGPIGSRSCSTCRFWRSTHTSVNNKHLAAYCMVPKGIRRVYGRDWLHKHGGDVGRMPAVWHTNCPSWEVPVPNRERGLAHAVFNHSNRMVWFQRFKRAQHYAPWPLDIFNGDRQVRSESWLALMDLIAARLPH